MALNNWDTLAFNNEGKACDGNVELASGASLEIYKNWVYIRHPKMWVAGCDFVNPTIANINSGSITIAGFDIKAIRGKEQESIFVFAMSGHGDNKIKFCGIGCSGYMDIIDWMKAKRPDLLEEIKAKHPDIKKTYASQYSSSDGTWGLSIFYGEDVPIPCKRPELDELWTGVRKDTYEEFLAWIKEQDPEYYEKLDRDNAARCVFCKESKD